MKGLALSIAMASRTDRLTSETKRKRVEDARTVVDQYVSSKQPVSSLGKIPWEKDVLAPWPVGFGLEAVKVRATHFEKNAIEIVHWLSEHKGSGLGAALDTYWEDLHATITDYPNISASTMSSKTMCQTTGICHCNVAGKKMKQFTKAVHTLQKRLFMEPVHKAKLSDGYVVLCLQSHVPMSASTVLGDYLPEELWAHIGLQYYSPYRSTFNLVERLPDIHPGFVPLPEPNAKVLLQVVGMHRLRSCGF